MAKTYKMLVDSAWQLEVIERVTQDIMAKFGQEITISQHTGEKEVVFPLETSVIEVVTEAVNKTLFEVVCIEVHDSYGYLTDNPLDKRVAANT